MAIATVVAAGGAVQIDRDGAVAGEAVLTDQVPRGWRVERTVVADNQHSGSNVALKHIQRDIAASAEEPDGGILGATRAIADERVVLDRVAAVAPVTINATADILIEKIAGDRGGVGTVSKIEPVLRGIDLRVLGKLISRDGPAP